jgi:hypothetical protein
VLFSPVDSEDHHRITTAVRAATAKDAFIMGRVDRITVPFGFVKSFKLNSCR